MKSRVPRLACFLLAFTLTSAMGTFAQSGAATADLHGTVTDQNNAVVSGAAVTLRDDTRNFERSVKSDAQGEYLFTLMPPGAYTVTVDAGGFAKTTLRGVRLNVGQRGELPITMRLAAATAEVTVDASAEVVETQRTAVATTIDEQRIDNLPINERNYINFSLTQSQVNRDNGRPIGPAPTSGLNIGGQRGRSTLVQVDGADNTDASVNAARSTLSQEAVQEFQVVTNSYAAEYGRASGGVINVVSKGGTNNFHGNLFGFIRHKSFQANNAFAPIDDAPYTRTQYGATFGGPIVKDRTFFFGAFEQRRRQESGFFTSDVRSGLTGTATIPVIPGLNPIARTFTNITPAQAAFIGGLVNAGGAAVCAARAYAFFASVGGDIALLGASAQASPNDGSVCNNPPPGGGGPISPILPGAIGPRFLLSGAPVPSATVNGLGQPIAFRPLTQLQSIFPISEGTTFSSVRLDQKISNNHMLNLNTRLNPSLITGLQVESQNQSLGQNDVSRTGVQRIRDWTAAGGLNSTLSTNLVNEAYFNWGRRSAAFRSQNGDAVASNISGTAFFGRELFSPVARVERRYQFRDTVSWAAGSHLFKFGGDYNFIDLEALFELNFAGLFNFGGLSARTLLCTNPAAPCAFVTAPDFTPVQQYGLGTPANFIQGFGNPRSELDTQPFSVFLQDSWRIRPNFTLNWGVRYDNEISSNIQPIAFSDPLSGIQLSAADLEAAQNALDVQQGFPRDHNNVAPRVAIAWDPWSQGKSVVRAAYGLFYDHPLLAVGFNSDIADAAQQQQLVSVIGSPSPTALLNASQIFQGTLCVPGDPTPTLVCAAAGNPATPGVASTAEYQFGRQRFNDQTFPGFGTVLPFTLPVTREFEYAYANQGNFSFEHQFSEDVSLSLGYLFVGSRHLPRPIDINAPQNNLLIENFRRLTGTNPANSTQALAFTLPAAPACATPAATNCTRIPGMVFVNAAGQAVVAPAIANFFRPNAPNYFLAQALSGGAVTKAVLDAALAGSLREPGVISPFGSMNAQSSNGTSNYHAMNVDLKKRFSRNFQFLGSYTWSHSIDDSSDLQTLLLPQDNRNLAAERADSLFDQRHRFVFSGILTSPAGWRSGGAMQRLFADFTIAPIVEASSGRPFNILTGVDTNNDQSNQTDRPNVGPGAVLVRPPDFDAICVCFPTGDLGRNRGITEGYLGVDLRIARGFQIGERVRFDVITEGFNLLNRFNQAAASPFFTDVNAEDRRNGSRYYSRATAAFDPRQFQFGLKLTF